MFSKNQIIAHRGASAYAPENTMSAFKEAHALGSRFIEFDVMLSVDGEPFVFHDESLKRTTSGQGEFGLVTADYLQSLDAGKWYSQRFKNERIPTLKDVLLWLTDLDMYANIEIKPYAGFVEQTTIAVLTYINRYWPSSKPLPLLSSLNQEALRLCCNFSPEVSLGWVINEWHHDWIQFAQEVQLCSMHLNKKLATKERVQSIKQAGYAVCVYTVNSKTLANRLFSWGVDAVFSDYPDVILNSGLKRFVKRHCFVSKNLGQ